MKLAAVCAVLAGVALQPADAGQMDIGTFGNLRRGMPESEVLLRAGAPDLVTSPHGEPIGDAGYVYDSHVRELHYVPGPEEHDPQLTVITITRGRVSALERRKIVAPLYQEGQPAPPPVSRGAQRTDTEIRRERADRTLEAAERYADVRARIKEREGEQASPSGRAPKVYRDTGTKGDAYFGDVPMRPDAGAEK